MGEIENESDFYEVSLVFHYIVFTIVGSRYTHLMPLHLQGFLRFHITIHNSSLKKDVSSRNAACHSMLSIYF